MNKETNTKLKSLLDIYDLPLPKYVKSPPNSSGIYFLENDDVLEYVGKAFDFSSSLNKVHPIYKPEVHKVYFIEIKNPHLCSGVEAAIISALKLVLNTDFNPDTVLFNGNDPKQELGTETEIKSDNTLIENTKKPLPDALVEIAKILLEFEIEQQYKAKLIAQGIANESDKIECIWSGNRITNYKILDQTISQRTRSSKRTGYSRSNQPPQAGSSS